MEQTPESKKKVILAIVGSIFFHLLLLLFFSFWMEVKANQPPVSPPDKPLELTILPEVETPEIAVAPTPPPEREMIRSDNFQEAATPPPDARFESDRDTAAGGNQPGTGPKNLPNVDGEQNNERSLRSQDVILGGKESSSSAFTPSKKPEEATPEPTPQATPVAQTTPKPAATPESVPEDAIALGRSTPTPAKPPAPTPPAPSGGGTYQPQTRATRMEGSLSNRGRPSVAARGTPLGRYLRQVENAIGSRWYFYIKRDAAFVAPGAVRIIFTIDRSGKAGGLRVLANTSNESFASTCTQSIMDAEFPAIPDEVASTLYTQRLELPFTFTIY